MEKITVEKLPITLTQFLKWAGLAMNGGEAKALIREGLVSLNGEICLVAGQKIKTGDVVSIEQQSFIVEEA
ncbi:MAG: RNA-binding S4 domain-containing protein [Clostridia bacterium]|jgi:ribosome-associated protein|nr:RNA-binding S4 domain-containing protein [Clostridia bacterium]MDD4571785.1 RNA-binding S4 domain-containing protein [Clostridia bacterium]